MHHPLTCHLHGIDLKKIQSEMCDQYENDKEGEAPVAASG